MADDVGRLIAQAHAEDSAAPEQVAAAIVRALFDTGSARLSAKDRYVAEQTVRGGLLAWRKQLLGNRDELVKKLTRERDEAKMEMEELKTKVYIMSREAKGK